MIYSIKDLSTMEIEICKTLNFKLQMSTPYQFLTIIQQISFNILGDSDLFTSFLSFTENFLMNFMLSKASITYSPKDIAIYIFNQSLNENKNSLIEFYSHEFGMISFNISNILKSVTMAAYNQKCLNSYAQKYANYYLPQPRPINTIYENQRNLMKNYNY